jgi:formyl-CoA transferase
VQAALLGAPLPKRPPPDRPRNALTNVYRTRDDRWIQLTIVREDRNWLPFCRVIGKEELVADPRFAEATNRRSNSPALAIILRETFAARDFADWFGRLKADAIPFAEISRAEDLPDDAQATAAGVFVETANPEMPRTLAAPFSLADVAVPPARPGPALGAHGDDILSEVGVSAQEIAALRASGALGRSEK